MLNKKKNNNNFTKLFLFKTISFSAEISNLFDLKKKDEKNLKEDKENC